MASHLGVWSRGVNVMALLFGQTVGPEVIFAPDPIGHVPRVTPLADGSFILAWQSDTGDLVAKHLNSAGSFTTGDFLLGLSSFANAQNWALTTPLIVQGQDVPSPPISAC
jgi:hypothetical protein